jgi:hypothetical protein
MMMGMMPILAEMDLASNPFKHKAQAEYPHPLNG